MSQENGHHHDDQTPHPDKVAEGNVLKDPVCGMDIGKDSPHHTEYGGGKIYRLRQSGIDEELFDVISGFEALNAEEK